MTKTMLGIVHGNSIELTSPLGFAEGQQVEVQVTVIATSKQWGEGITNSAGALQNDDEWDDIMEEVQRDRQLDRPSQLD